jgi:SAM-dependent methyltransferase
VIDVEHANRVHHRYPMTVRDKGWVYGVWYCGTAWDRVKLYGQYPPTFLARALALFPQAQDVLHIPSGTIEGNGVTVDRMVDDVRKPMIVADAGALPFRGETFDLVLSDPPYSREDSAKYGCPPWPQKKAMAEAHRVLRVGGHLGVLHLRYPSYRRKDWELVGLIAVVTGFQRATRIFSLFEKRAPSMQEALAV